MSFEINLKLLDMDRYQLLNETLTLINHENFRRKKIDP